MSVKEITKEELKIKQGFLTMKTEAVSEAEAGLACLKKANSCLIEYARVFGGMENEIRSIGGEIAITKLYIQKIEYEREKLMDEIAMLKGEDK